MNSSRSSVWLRVRRLEDVLAALAAVDDRRRVIRVQAWNEGDWGTVFAEATAMKEDLADLKALLACRWQELFDDARGVGA